MGFTDRDTETESRFQGPADLAPGCVGSTSGSRQLSLWSTGKLPVSLGLSFFRNKTSFDLMGHDLLQLWWFFWPSDFLFYYLSSSQSLEARWIFSFFRWANGSSGILTWLEPKYGKTAGSGVGRSLGLSAQHWCLDATLPGERPFQWASMGMALFCGFGEMSISLWCRTALYSLTFMYFYHFGS